MTQRSMAAVGALIAVASLALFVWALNQAGLEPVRAALGRVGAGFFVIVLLGGVRGVLRALAWTCAVAPPQRLDFRRAVTTFFAGEALGNVTPLGPLVGEPVRIALVNSQLSFSAALSARAVETLFYGATILLMWTIGVATLLGRFPVPFALTGAASALLAGAGVIALAALRGLRRRGLLPRSLLSGIFGFVARRPGSAVRILLLDLLYHAAAVLEIWIALRFITGEAPPLSTAVVLECLNRAIMVAFQFVPMWFGVDEAGTGLVASVLHLGTATGVTLALVRKARILCWTAVGLVSAFAHGVTLGGDAGELTFGGDPGEAPVEN